jgi:hypothetical protein
LSEILRGDEQGAGDLDALIAAARREQNVGDCLLLDLQISADQGRAEIRKTVDHHGVSQVRP